MINQSPGNNLVLHTLCDRSVFPRQAIINFGTIIHDDEVVTTLTMMMNLCNSVKQMINAIEIIFNENENRYRSPFQRIKIYTSIEVHIKESKSIAMVLNSMQRRKNNSSNHKIKNKQ